MRIAYLFAESSPNLDIDFRVFNAFSPAEFNQTSSMVRAGAWGLYLGQGGKTLDEIIAERLMPVFYSGDGQLAKPKLERLVEAVHSDNVVYTLQFMTLRRPMALALHERLSTDTDYLGCIQVRADKNLHHQVFGVCGPRYEVDGGKLYILYSSDMDDEWFADDILNHFRTAYSEMKFIHLTAALEKRDIGMRHSSLDAHDPVSTDIPFQKSLSLLSDVWDEHAEMTLYRLQDSFPTVQQELFAALQVLDQPQISPESAAQLAVSMRRVLEEITRHFCGPGERKPGWVKRHWKQYAQDNKQRLGFYADVITSEAIGIDHSVGRLGMMLSATNKGVHEDWDVSIARSLMLRLVLLIHDVMMVVPKRRTTLLDQDYFLQFLDDED